MHIDNTNKTLTATQKHTLDPNKWIANYGDYLLNYGYSRLSSREVAEDLLQDTFMSALKAQGGFRGDSSEQTWLTSILKRKIIDYYRKKSTQNELNESRINSQFKDSGFLEGHWEKSSAPKDWSDRDPNSIHQKEFQIILEECISYLPEKLRGVFILKVMEEMESEDVCKELGCSASNFWVILHRARLRLRECIENNWLNE